jgi:hypothetical protein
MRVDDLFLPASVQGDLECHRERELRLVLEPGGPDPEAQLR